MELLLFTTQESTIAPRCFGGPVALLAEAGGQQLYCIRCSTALTSDGIDFIPNQACGNTCAISDSA